MADEHLEAQLEKLNLDAFKRVVFFTGAGLSVASGIPTYQGTGGTWKTYRWEDLACEEAFARDPERVWDFHDWRREQVAKCAPNAAHDAIATFVQRHPHSVVITQNIDGLHQKSGAKDVLELHGSLWRVRVEDDRGRLVAPPEENFDVPLQPRRHNSGHYFRPDIVWFGDALRRDVIAASLNAMTTCDCLVSIGTSAQVYPAAQLPLTARESGATMVEINPEPTPMSDVYDMCIRAPATAVLPRICS